MKSFIFTTVTAEETMKLAQDLAAKLLPRDVITMEGDLGAGKTTFTKGLALGLGIKRNVSSPTFTIIKEYRQGRYPLYHMDVYRLEESDEDLGFAEYFHGDGITVVEWAQFIAHELPEELLQIDIRRISDRERQITFTPKGERYLQLCKELENESISN